MTSPRPSSAPSWLVYRDHYRPVTASALATGTIDLPRGASPVVLTFDDSAKSQAGLLEDGRIDPDSAVGIMLDFAKAPRLPAGWDVLRQPRAVRRRPEAGEIARRLIALGFELGNHTLDHVRLDELTDEEVQREIVLGNRLIRELVPDVEIETIALPFGLLPESASSRSQGRGTARLSLRRGVPGWRRAVAIPVADDFDAREIPRIRTDPRSLLNGSSDWLSRLETSRSYVTSRMGGVAPRDASASAKRPVRCVIARPDTSE